MENHVLLPNKYSSFCDKKLCCSEQRFAVLNKGLLSQVAVICLIEFNEVGMPVSWQIYSSKFTKDHSYINYIQKHFESLYLIIDCSDLKSVLFQHSTSDLPKNSFS